MAFLHRRGRVLVLLTCFISTWNLGLWLTVAARGQASTPRLDEAVRNEDWNSVLHAAQKEVNAHGGSTEAWTYLGLAQLHLLKLAEAKKSLAKALALAPQATYTHNNYGAALEALGLPLQAELEYERSLQLNPSQPAALVNLARLRTAKGKAIDRASAHQLLQQAWKLAPDREIAGSLLLTLPCALGDGSVVPFAEKAEAEQIYRWVEAEDSARPQPANMTPAMNKQLGSALLGCGLLTDAQREYELVAAANSSDTEAISGIARAQVAEGNFTDAGKTLERAVRDGHDSGTIYALLADVYEKTGHLENAIPAMRLAIDKAPDNQGFRFRYAVILIAARAPKAAAIRMQEAVLRFPSSARMWFGLGLTQFESEDVKASQNAFDRALALDPDLVPALAYRGLVALDLGRFEEAQTYYRRALDRDSGSADLHCLMAEAIEKQYPDRPELARGELLEALKLQPDLARAYLMLGRLDLKEQPDRAVEDLHRALSLDPSLNEAHYHLARAYRILHNAPAAAEESAKFKTTNDAKGPEERTAFSEAVQRLADVRF